MKKIALLTTSIALLAATHVKADEAAGGFHSGLYTAAMAGVTYNRNSMKNRLVVPGTLDSTLKASKHKTSAIGELILGGRKAYGPWVYGLEVAVNKDGHKATRLFDYVGNGTTFNGRIEKKMGIVPALTLGRTMGEKGLVFVKLGMSINRYGFKLFNVQANQVFSDYKTKLGFAPSIGYEHSFNHRISGLATIGYEWNGSVKGKFNNPIVDPNIVSSNTLKVKTSAFVGKVGVLIKM